MLKKTVSAIYVINIAFQAIFTLLWQIGAAFLIAYLLITYLHAPEWLYAVFILLGVFSGLYGMVRFILSACQGLDRLEEQHRQDEIRNKNKNGDKNESKQE